MSQVDEGGVLLTLHQVRQWKMERDDVAAEVAKLQTKLDELDRRLGFVEVLMTPQQKAALFGQAEVAETEKSNFYSWIKSLLAGRGGGITLQGVLAASEGTEFQERLSRNPNSLYNAVSRLAEKGEIKRAGRAIFSPEVYERITAEGRDPAETVEGAVEEPTGPEIVRNIVAAHGSGMTTSEIIRKLRTHRDLGEKLARNPQYGYTLISRMVKRGQLVRDGQEHFVPR